MPDLTPGLAGVLDLLRCPRCAGALSPGAGVVRCPAGHAFDVARQGYVSLLGGARATSGDDDAMARARERFLASGAYADLLAAVVRACGALPAGGTVLDVGCGTGYYLGGVLEARPANRGVGLDTSARALRVAARAHPNAGAVGWDVLQPYPLADACADVVLDVFSPRNPPEIHRVLRPGGRLVVARPAPAHLGELRTAVPGMVAIDPAKEDRLALALGEGFTAGGTEHVERVVALSPEQARDLVAMTPSARHLGAADLAALPDAALPAAVTVSVLVTSFARR